MVEQFRRDGLVFDVVDEGPGDGDAVVLLHGFPADGSSWGRVTPHLHAAGLRTLAPDQRGYSRGARPARRRDYVLDELVADVVALMDTAELDTAHVVGHDLGGTVAWGLASAVPHRLRSLTVLSTPHPAAFVQAIGSSDQAMRSWYMLAAQLPVLPEVTLRRRLGRQLRRSGLSALDAARYAARMAEPGALSAALNWYRAMPWAMRSPTVRRIGVPTTYVWGNRDVALGRRGAELTVDFVTADYRFVELDAGHWLPEEHADEVAPHVLERVRGSHAEPA